MTNHVTYPKNNKTIVAFAIDVVAVVNVVEAVSVVVLKKNQFQSEI